MSDNTVEYKSWEELRSALLNSSGQGWIFRGVSNFEYRLYSALERIFHNAKIPSAEWINREIASLGFFKERAKVVLHNTPQENDLLGWLTLMQHYGAPTRLTDWTTSPFVACYFALDRINDDAKDAAIWMLPAGKYRMPFGTFFSGPRDHFGTQSLTTSTDGEVEVTFPGAAITEQHILFAHNDLLRQVIIEQQESPLPLSILRPDSRMMAQQGCFVVSGKLSEKDNPTPIEKLVSHSNGAIKKIRLPYAWRQEVFRTLIAMNITADTLFPGLDGVGRTTEHFIQHQIPTSLGQQWYMGC
jgi:hypothetical protein